ncbi:MAG: hypothetical protein KatS3mg105_0363 [Gemmatales bacterium]|nr:MAG: hypothetical protein KatS3mg105_0363 [Gemmatales bacterium]
MKSLRMFLLFPLAFAILLLRVEPASADWKDVVLRPVFYTKNEIAFPGTAFIIKDGSGNYYALTAAHLLDDKQWEQVQRVDFFTMQGKLVARAVGQPVYRGRQYEYRPLKKDGAPRDPTKDLVIFRVKIVGTVKPLTLAPDNVVTKPGERVWVVGRHHKQGLGTDKLYRAVMLETDRHAYFISLTDKFDGHGFSGGPIVNSKSQVIGNVIAGNKELILGASAAALRARLRQHGIFPK